MAGNLSHTVSLSYSGQGQTTLRGAAVQGSSAPIFSMQIPASSTNLAISIPAFVLANLQSIIINVDANTTLKTNSSGSPQDTLTLTAAAPFVWQAGSGVTAQFAGNVTAWYATTGGTPANLTALILTS